METHIVLEDSGQIQKTTIYTIKKLNLSTYVLLV